MQFSYKVMALVREFPNAFRSRRIQEARVPVSPQPTSSMRSRVTALQVLFVCTGNTCRSPSAEGVLRKYLADAGLGDRISVDSAGTQNDRSGQAPDPRAVHSCAQRGYDLTDLRARSLTPGDFETFDIIAAMARGHVEILQRLCPPGQSHRLQLFLDHAQPPLKGQDVPDPYYGGPDDYEHVLDLIEHGMSGLIAHLQGRL